MNTIKIMYDDFLEIAKKHELGVIAGGFPRDASLRKIPTDIDFFTYPGISIVHFREIFSATLEPTSTSRISTGSAKYPKSFHVINTNMDIYTAFGVSFPLQIMFDHPLTAAGPGEPLNFNSFHASICHSYIDPESFEVTPPPYTTFNVFTNASRDYRKKIMDKFPDIPHIVGIFLSQSEEPSK